MIRITPNKRKSTGGTLDPVTPKKTKNDSMPIKTPGNTPKSAKKGKLMGNGTPGVQKTPKVTDVEGETTEILTKTPKSGKKGKKNQQTVTNGDVANQEAEVPVPKSAKKNKKKDNEDSTATSEMNVAKGETPKKQKMSPKGGASLNEGKLKKFKGTKPINENTTPKAPITKESLMNLSKRQRKRKLRKLRQQVAKSDRPMLAKKETSIAAKTVAEINETESTKQKAKRNRKKKNMMNKSLPIPTNEAEKPKKEAKTDDSSTENMEQDSDYEVETQIKPEIITKSLNETQDSDDGDESDNEVSDSESEETKPKNKKEKQIELRDLSETGIVQKGQKRYVLYVNNIPYTATKEQVVEHFSKKCTPTDVRLPTDKNTNKPRGFAYVEFKDEEDYQKGLSLHHSFLDRRRINVQYTKPGEKNSDDKKKEIKQKNLKLQGMRKQGLLAGSEKDSQKRSVRRGKKKALEKEQAEAE